MVALIYYDSPYNVLPNVSWEFQISVEYLSAIMKQVNASQMGTWYIFAIVHKPLDTQIVMEAFEAEGFVQMQHLFWYKEGHQTKTPESTYTNSVEMITVGFKPDRSKCGWNMGADPRGRHNHFVCKSVTNYFKYEDGSVVNPSQKPPDLLRWLCQNHLHAGDRVLVIGAGSGADIIGATQACCHVVAVELDDKQFGRLQTNLVKYSTSVEIKMGIEQDDDVSEGDKRLSVGSNKSTNDDDEDDEEGSSVCPECQGKLLHSEIDMKRVCHQCTNGFPLHANCCELMPDGTWLCHTCYQENSGIGNNEGDQDDE
jgi:hypothetical protein